MKILPFLIYYDKYFENTLFSKICFALIWYYDYPLYVTAMKI